MTTPDEMWAWAPEAVLSLGRFVFVVLVPMLCIGWGIQKIRETSS